MAQRTLHAFRWRTIDGPGNLARETLLSASESRAMAASVEAGLRRGRLCAGAAGDDVHQCRTVTLELDCADAGDTAQCRKIRRTLARDFRQCLVVQDDECGDRLGTRLGQPPRLETIEQGAVRRGKGGIRRAAGTR